MPYVIPYKLKPDFFTKHDDKLEHKQMLESIHNLVVNI